MYKAAATYGTLQPFVLEERKIPDPPAGGAVVKVVNAGMCQTDVGIWTNHFTSPDFSWPWVPGHEVSGVVYSRGADVAKDSPKVGDKVAVHSWWGCSSCDYCKAGDEIFCNIVLDKSIGITFDGGYAEYIVVHDSVNLVKLPNDMDMAMAALLPCSGLTSFNAVYTVYDQVVKTVKTAGDCRLLIVGAGGLGLWAVGFAKAMFPPTCKVIVADVSEEKLRPAKEAGADVTVCWDPNCTDEAALVQRTLEAIGGPVEACIDFVNVSKTSSRVLGCSRTGATWVMVGLLGDIFELPVKAIVLKSINIIGLLTGNLILLKKLVNFVSKYKVRPPPIELVKLDQATEVLTRLMEGKIQGRAIFAME